MHQCDFFFLNNNRSKNITTLDFSIEKILIHSNNYLTGNFTFPDQLKNFVFLFLILKV